MYIVKIIENYYAEFYRLPRCLIKSGIEYINCVILKSLGQEILCKNSITASNLNSKTMLETK